MKKGRKVIQVKSLNEIVTGKNFKRMRNNVLVVTNLYLSTRQMRSSFLTVYDPPPPQLHIELYQIAIAYHALIALNSVIKDPTP
jgi:hypothetical protein